MQFFLQAFAALALVAVPASAMPVTNRGDSKATPRSTNSLNMYASTIQVPVDAHCNQGDCKCSCSCASGSCKCCSK
ncbi:hypothetical protein GGG16DRAFT_117402 [Schizophyllum commune]